MKTIVNAVACATLIVSIAGRCATAAEKQRSDETTYTRQAVFELTYRNSDLVWLGDPASPNALAYPKRDARPIATDFHVTTLAESRASRTRRYFREARIADDSNELKVYAFTESREKVIGTIDKDGRFSPNEAYAESRTATQLAQ